MPRLCRTVATVDIERVPGYLYFIDKDGDVGRIKRATGHYPGRSGPLLKAAIVGIDKRPGFWYYLHGSRIMERKRHNSR